MARKEAIAADKYSYTIIIEPAEEGGYVVTCPTLRGVATQGETLEEARAMAADAIQGYSSACVRTASRSRRATSLLPGRSVIE